MINYWRYLEMGLDRILLDSLFYLFSIYGIATIISSEFIFSQLTIKLSRFTSLYTLLTCNRCLSVWVGFFVSLAGFQLINVIFDPFISYTFCCLMNKLLDKTED
jgi:hypothetical protein